MFHARAVLSTSLRVNRVWFLPVCMAILSIGPLQAQVIVSHPPLRPLPVSSPRPLPSTPVYFVDAQQGDDANAGTKDKPWRSINASLPKLSAGDTLCLRGGSYFERVYCAIAGTAEKPIVIRSHPNEIAVIDGGLPEFQRDPASAWEPVPDGVAGEYRSTHIHKNIRDVVGLFGDSNVGLQTYWYRMDLQAENELWIPNAAQFIDPIYCGPGLWYDKQTGRIHARLAHTKLKLPKGSTHKLVQYQGETDPRKLPLVVAPYDAAPLMVDQAMYVRFEDLVFRGGGRTTVNLMFGVGISFDHCTVYAGNYAISSKGTGPLTMTHCGVFGMIAPWFWRSESSLYAYSGRVYPPFVGEAAEPEVGGGKREPKQVVRHISRLPTHALLITEGGYEFETFYHPHNHDWDISHCEFTDGHDGVYLSGREIHFHHNLVDNMQDDAVYISSPTPYISDNIFASQNLIRQAVCGFGGHARGGPGGKIYLFRNIIDLRAPLQFSRPSKDKPQGDVITGHSAWFVHSGDHILHMEHMNFYHNTTLTPVNHPLSAYVSGMPFGFHPDSERRVFNNLCAYTGGSKQYPVAFGIAYTKGNLALDGNLLWHSDPTVPIPPDYFKTSRTHPLSEANKSHYPAGWDAHSLIVDPKFLSFSTNAGDKVDIRLKPDSPAIGAGVVLPPGWLDPLRPANSARPDIGALPVGSEPLRVGINGRTIAGDVRP
ncbi:MAG: hypothetical protein JWN70_3558 [Planctomycetaceae bacterium]|nr:hypothetical protein [Planctomycetaceae bacterium]